MQPILQFFKRRGWAPFPFQIETWQAYLRGDSGLVYVPTGSGKTYAGILGPMARLLARPAPRSSAGGKTKAPRKATRVLYLTPLRALARDLELALKEPLEQEGWPLTVQSRTGDTSAATRRRQLTHPPDILLTTPESLSVMISQLEGDEFLKHVECVVLDEWHELLASKRGTMTELSLAYLRFLNPDLQVWALSASLGNLDEAARLAVGRGQTPVLIRSGDERKLEIECLLPKRVDRFPWAGHLGLVMIDALLADLDPEQSTLIFANTRFMAEKWFESLWGRRPDMRDRMAVHHSSLSREEREAVEEGVKSGALKWVVCTSSLDLGVDFQPVEKCVQIGSPKMVARLLQRAGRSAHRPGARSRLVFVPTHVWEILELEAVKKALAEGHIESRHPLHKPIDVLLQHLTTLACGPGFRVDEIWEQLRNTYAFGDLTRAELNWCLRFLTRGGEVLRQYSQFHKLTLDDETGRYRLMNSKMAALHRLSIGTIVSRESVNVVDANRSRIGTIQENFISSLKKGDVFQFAGRKLELLLIKDMTAYVQSTSRPTNTIPSWSGTNLPISETLAQAFREVLDQRWTGPLGRVLEPVLRAQRNDSYLPDAETLLIEKLSSQEGEHLFVYPFEGRLVHEGLAHLWASRFAAREASTFSFSVNDYGFEILAPRGYDFEGLFDSEFFSTDSMAEEIGLSLQMSEMSRRQFREVAQIAGLVFSGYPGHAKTGKQRARLSSSLLYDVFSKYEPGNLLIRQSYDEVLRGSLESERLRAALERLARLRTLWKTVDWPSPLSFPLLIERVASHLSNESMEAKVERLKRTWEKRVLAHDELSP